MAKKSGFFKNIFSNPNKKQKQTWSTGTIAFGSGSSYYLSDKSVIKISEFYSAIDMIANDIASINYRPSNIKTNESKTIRYLDTNWESPWNKILNKKPNTFMSKTEFFKNSIFDLFIRGAFYWYIYKDSKGNPLELIPVDPETIKKVKSESSPSGYKYELTLFNDYKSNDIDYVSYEDIISVHYSDIERVSDAQFKYVHSTLLEQLGLKSLYDTQQLNQAPRVLAKAKTPESLTEKSKEELKTSLTEFFEAAKDVSRSAILIQDPKAEIEIINSDKSMITSPLAKEFVNQIMTNLANALHIPLPKLNIVTSGQSYYKSREGINIDYINDAVVPWAEKIVAKLNEVIYPNKSKKEFKYEISKLLSVDKATQAEYLSKMRQNGIYTTNELRNVAGLPPVDNGDVIYGNGTLTELGKGGTDG